MSHTERLHLKFTPTQLFDLVADVEHYPDFLPWVIAARILRRDDQTLWVDMTMGDKVCPQTIFNNRTVGSTASD